MISGLGLTGVSVLGGSTGFAAQEKPEPMTRQKLEDPKAKYLKPPFKEQSQPWPSLASKMDPRRELRDSPGLRRCGRFRSAMSEQIPLTEASRARDFDEVARPEQGRCAREPAHADASGMTYIPAKE